MEKQKNKIIETIKKNFDLMTTPLMSILPGQISFFVILSLIPLASIFVMIVSKLSFNFDAIYNIIYHYLPESMSNVIVNVLMQQQVQAIDFFFIIMAFYLASKATHSIIVASTQIYNGKQENFIRTRIKAIIMLLILTSLAFLVISVFIFGSKFVFYLSRISQNINPIVSLIYNFIKWPFAFFIIFLTIKVIYTIAPNVNIPSKSVNKGAKLTTIVWLLSTYAYTLYITNFANYTKFYGNLSNLIILVVWIYWLCYIFVYGMTVNKSNFDKENNKKVY